MKCFWRGKPLGKGSREGARARTQALLAVLGWSRGNQAAVAVTAVLLSGKHIELRCFHLKYWPASCPDQHYPTCIFSLRERFFLFVK